VREPALALDRRPICGYARSLSPTREQDGLVGRLDSLRRAVKSGVNVEPAGVQHGDDVLCGVPIVGHRHCVPVGGRTLHGLAIAGLEGRQQPGPGFSTRAN